MRSPFALYIHIPFCEHICHYCDFAKTARYHTELVDEYFKRLRSEIVSWTRAITNLTGEAPQWQSVFFGGGTPGLFSHEYETIFAELMPNLMSGTEISLEVNPHNVTAEKKSIWAQLGFNRVSMGVQTFSPAGLKILTRDHDVDSVFAAIELLRNEPKFNKISIDLIYGWPTQSLNDWESDLKKALDLDIGHLSLYTLTYEPRTPLGRRYHRGLVKNTMNDEMSADFYAVACDQLCEKRYDHVELANWARKQNICRHNQSYWTDEYFVGIGAGAHGYLPADSADDANQKIGIRYSCAPNVHSYLRDPSPQCEFRTNESWLFEYVGSGLRSQWGLDVKHMLDRSGAIDWRPTSALKNGQAQGHVISSLDPSKKLIFSESAWFLENLWAQEVILSVILPAPRATTSNEVGSPTSQMKSPRWFGRD